MILKVMSWKILFVVGILFIASIEWHGLSSPLEGPSSITSTSTSTTITIPYGDTGPWMNTTPYPIGIGYDQVKTSGNYIYVFGAGAASGAYPNHETNVSFYAPITSKGIGNWIVTTNTPTGAIVQTVCTAYDSKAYCAGDPHSYFANLSSSGIGQWIETTPLTVGDGTQCFNYRDYMCCVGGFAPSATSATYCAYLSGNGIGRWTPSTPYPEAITKQRMAIYNDTLYSIGGITDGTYGQINDSFYAPLTPNGIGNWTRMIDFPIQVRSFALTAYEGYLYAVGGIYNNYDNPDNGAGSYLAALDKGINVFYAPIRSDGIGKWIASVHAYPYAAVYHLGCAQNDGSYYCVGGMGPTVDAFFTSLAFGINHTSNSTLGRTTEMSEG
jgi:hypothetical protein